MKLDKVESVSSLVSAMEAKKAEAEAKRGSLKAEMDQLMDEADKLEAQVKAKRRDAKDLYKQIGALDYGNWVSDVMWPLVDELARRTGKKASILGPNGIGSKIIVILADEERDSEWYLKERLEIVLEPDFSGESFSIRYETGEVSDLYAPGTLGHESGLNNITAPLPDSVEEILGLLRLYPATTNKDKGGKENE